MVTFPRCCFQVSVNLFLPWTFALLWLLLRRLLPMNSGHFHYLTCQMKTRTPYGQTLTNGRQWKQTHKIPLHLLFFVHLGASVQFSSVAQSCPTLCDPMNCSTPGLPVHHQLPEFTQTHVHRVSDAIQPFHPLWSPSAPAPNPSQHQSLFPVSQVFTWGGQSTGVSALASFLPKNTQDWSLLEWTGWISLQSKGLSRVFSNTTVQKHQFFGAQLSSQSNSHILGKIKMRKTPEAS